MGYCLRYLGRDFKIVGTLTVGRGASCTIPLDDPLVSRTHATISVQGDSVVVEDRRSRNGVTLNGQPISGTAEAGPGDVIGIGSQQMVLVEGDGKGEDFLDGQTITTKDHTVEEPTPPSRAAPVEFITLGGREYAVMPKDVYFQMVKGRQTLDGVEAVESSRRGKKSRRR